MVDTTISRKLFLNFKPNIRKLCPTFLVYSHLWCAQSDSDSIVYDCIVFSLQDYHSIIWSRRICKLTRKSSVWPWKLTSPTGASKHRQASRNLCTCTCHLAHQAKHQPEKLPKQFSFQIQIDTVPSQCQVIKTDTVITLLTSPTSQHPLYSIQEVQDSSLRATARVQLYRKLIL